MSTIYDNATRKILLIAVVLGLVSLALPWWNLVAIHHGQLLSYFGSNVWGVMKTGFLRSDLSYEWWSFTTFVLVGVACASGLFGYHLVKTNRKTARTIVLLELVATLAACVFYVVLLSNAFPNSLFSARSGLWIIQGGNPPISAEVGVYQLFHYAYASSVDVLWAEFLSAGFFVALASALFSFIALYRITNAMPRTSNSNSAK